MNIGLELLVLLAGVLPDPEITTSLIAVLVLEPLLAFAYCLSSLIQQTQKFFADKKDPSDARTNLQIIGVISLESAEFVDDRSDITRINHNDESLTQINEGLKIAQSLQCKWKCKENYLN
ncbi:hypothetical protein L1987_71594 [Smallanthus sonchifolius]|uniref:Uncharacterized protein n=1 Tax=Smallanthus sonchifolius TaxID=185202 RepID=A0ACB9AS07_9ASTR|nr:hypothetical protein L1987_71594 [Smallanthus sonchifolius]